MLEACRTALAASAVLSPASPRCPVPDDLDGGPCCTLASPFVPAFPRFEQDALEICWHDCDVEAVLPGRAAWNDVHVLPRAGLPCGERRIRLDLRNAGGTSITTPVEPLLTGFVSTGIGSWTLGASFPGIESLRWNAGAYDVLDPCTPVPRREVFFGVTTLGGYPARQLTLGGPGAPLPPTFVDQSNSLAPRSLGTTSSVPFVSDHFLALNP